MMGEESPGFIPRLPNGSYAPFCRRNSLKTGAGTLREERILCHRSAERWPGDSEKTEQKDDASSCSSASSPHGLPDLLPVVLEPCWDAGTSSGEQLLRSRRQEQQHCCISDSSGALAQRGWWCRGGQAPGPGEAHWASGPRSPSSSRSPRGSSLGVGGYAEVRTEDRACSPQNLSALEEIKRARSSRPPD